MSTPTTPSARRGAEFGLPEAGRGSLATAGARIGAWVVDALASAFVAALFVAVLAHGRHGHPVTTSDRLPGYWSLIPFFLDYVVGMLVAGRTLGMYLFGLRVIRVDRDDAVGPGRAVVRTLLLMLLLPAIVFDRNGRGLHDRFTDTAVVRN